MSLFFFTEQIQPTTGSCSTAVFTNNFSDHNLHKWHNFATSQPGQYTIKIDKPKFYFAGPKKNSNFSNLGVSFCLLFFFHCFFFYYFKHYLSFQALASPRFLCRLTALIKLLVAVQRQSVLYTENSGFASQTLGQHISTFRGYQILFSIINLI